MADKDNERAVSSVLAPPLYNKRAGEQWQIIKQLVDFKDKIAIDLGCGYGDLVFRIGDAGAHRVWGVDWNKEIVSRNRKVLHNQGYPSNIIFVYDDIRDFPNREPSQVPTDVAICFSVLPYLEAPDKILRWMADNADMALIECQYDGDGPGFDFIKDDEGMRIWLQGYWDEATPIGSTHVKDRGVDRTIWLCQ